MKTLLIILCALCANVAFSQNVRTKPILKKQTTTKVVTKPTTKKPVGKKKTTKKKSYNKGYYDYGVDSVAYDYVADTVAYDEYVDSMVIEEALPISESADQLARYLVYPLGTIEINMLEKSNSYNSITEAVKNCYTLSSTSDANRIWVYANNNPTLNYKYHGLPFYNFCIDRAPKYDWHRDLLYGFEISKENMTRGVYDYLDLIVSDLNELGFPISYQKKNDEYIKAKGEIRVGDVELEIEVNDYGSVYQYQIKLYLY